MIQITASGKGEVVYKRERREEKLIIDIRNFKACEPKEVTTKRYKGLAGEITWIVHVTADGKITYERLN